jgi:hypothetical protein
MNNTKKRLFILDLFFWYMIHLALNYLIIWFISSDPYLLQWSTLFISLMVVPPFISSGIKYILEYSLKKYKDA